MHRSRARLLALAAIAPLATLAAPALAASAEARAAADAALTAPIDLERFREHLYTLSSPFLEGRLPGTRGGEIAADYIEFHLRRIGLEPAFPTGEAAADGSQVISPATSYRQPFEIRGELKVDHAHLALNAQPFTPGVDFNLLPFSGNNTVTAPLAFAGYSITMADDGYTSYPEGADLTGKIALILRFEPMNEDGSSKYAEQGWSFLAGLSPKIGAAVRRGAAGVILVSPPNADDPRAGNLESIDSMGTGATFEGVPVAMVTPAVADAILRAADPDARSLDDFIALANTSGGVIDLPNASLTLASTITEIPIVTDNVGALLPGAGDLAGDLLVIGAHYDHLGYGKFGSRTPNRNEIHPGADDNASGTAGVLLIAERLARAYDALGDTPRRSVLFLLFTAEESGLHGARFYVENPIRPVAQHEAMLNFDMIGRLRDELDLGGFGSAEGFLEELQPILDSSGLTVDPGMSGRGPSDHAPFYGAGIPVLFFHTGLHDVYHTPDDTVDTINEEGAVRVADLGARIALHLATDREDLTFTSSDNDQGGMRAPRTAVKVRFGIMPGDYDSQQPGILIGDTFEGTSAANAGLQKGDRMIRWNDQELTDVESWMPLLAQHEPGDEVTITYIRNGEEKTTTARLQGRDAAR